MVPIGHHRLSSKTWYGWNFSNQGPQAPIRWPSCSHVPSDSKPLFHPHGTIFSAQTWNEIYPNDSSMIPQWFLFRTLGVSINSHGIFWSSIQNHHQNLLSVRSTFALFRSQKSLQCYSYSQNHIGSQLKLRIQFRNHMIYIPIISTWRLIPLSKWVSSP